MSDISDKPSRLSLPSTRWPLPS